MLTFVKGEVDEALTVPAMYARGSDGKPITEGQHHLLQLPSGCVFRVRFSNTRDKMVPGVGKATLMASEFRKDHTAPYCPGIPKGWKHDWCETMHRDVFLPDAEVLTHTRGAIDESKTEKCMLIRDADGAPMRDRGCFVVQLASGHVGRVRPDNVRITTPTVTSAIAPPRNAQVSTQPGGDAAARVFSESSRDRSSGAGFGDPETNKLVEIAAIEAVKKHYHAGGWVLRSTEADGCGYDLLCLKEGREEHIEVKGVRGESQEFIITATERKRAITDSHFAVFVVTRVLTENPKLTRYSGEELLVKFSFEPLQFKAKRIAETPPH
ncbi:MAG TPA: DUF3883 domain-containing protein [Thermoanaerobaculia bacterium]|nr:DUF3883 domain-containing protein [Thermoanaerobaculia bacterium]